MKQIVRCDWCGWLDYEDELLPSKDGMAHSLCPSCDREESLVEVDCYCTFNDQQIEKLWELLTDVPFDEESDGSLVLAEDWFGFEAGTEREEIWYWFDENYSDGVAALMYGKED